MKKAIKLRNSSAKNSSLDKIYVFGNTLLRKDRLAVSVSEKLKKDFPKTRFVHVDPNEEILERCIVILDVAKGIGKVSVIENISQLEFEQKVSPHDLDVTFFLKLMKKVGLVKKIKIIAIPMHYTQKKAYEEVKKIMST